MSTAGGGGRTQYVSPQLLFHCRFLCMHRAVVWVIWWRRLWSRLTELCRGASGYLLKGGAQLPCEQRACLRPTEVHLENYSDSLRLCQSTGSLVAVFHVTPYVLKCSTHLILQQIDVFSSVWVLISLFKPIVCLCLFLLHVLNTEIM